MHTKAKYVGRKFKGIVPAYDPLNTLFSLGLDATWRRDAGRILRKAPLPEGPVLDLCAGTLAQALEVVWALAGRQVVAVDFLKEMLAYGKKKRAGAPGLSNTLSVAGDGLSLPFGDDTFGACTVSFGLRNLADIKAGLSEIRRTLKPSGMLVVLDFAWPKSPFLSQLYNFYLGKIMPLVGGMVSGDPGAYRYLFSSVKSFKRPGELAALFRECGYKDVAAKELSFGIVAVVSGRK